MFIFVWFFVPETKGTYLPSVAQASVPISLQDVSPFHTGVSLEKMDELFGVVESPKTLGDDAAPQQKTEAQVTQTERVA
jgi:hypothetical protein